MKKEITEYDGYKMPEPFKGEITLEIVEERKKSWREMKKFIHELKMKYNIPNINDSMDDDSMPDWIYSGYKERSIS